MVGCTTLESKFDNWACVRSEATTVGDKEGVIIGACIVGSNGFGSGAADWNSFILCEEVTVELKFSFRNLFFCEFFR